MSIHRDLAFVLLAEKNLIEKQKKIRSMRVHGGATPRNRRPYLPPF